MDQWFSNWCPGSPKEMVESLELRPGSGLEANVGAFTSRTLPILYFPLLSRLLSMIGEGKIEPPQAYWLFRDTILIST